MTDCGQIYGFLTEVSGRKVTTNLPDADFSTLQQLNFIQFLSADQYAQLVRDVQALPSTGGALAAERASRAGLAQQVEEENRKSHSILFHFEGHEKQSAELQKEAQDQAALKSMDADLTARAQQFDQTVARRSMLDTLSPYGNGFIALTGTGVMQTRELGIRLYRVSDVPFSTYWEQSQHTEQELNNVAILGAQYVAQLSVPLRAVDRSYLWAISIGLAKREPDPSHGTPAFMDAYNRLGKLSHNEENRLMSAEILSSAPGGIEGSLPTLDQLDHDVRKAGVPKESSLGVASILLLGRRQDGTFATANLANFLKVTKSYESAALLAVINRPFEELSGKFASLRSMFGGWGFQPSEDVELSSAYLTVSELPIEGVGPKLAILVRGLATYLQFPLVAASILTSIPVLEANETLNLLERAYEIVGARAGPATPSELICLAVRMVQGIRVGSVDELDATAAARAGPTGGPYLRGPGFFFLPVIVAHGVYYSTFSGMGGAHPGHAHFGGGFVG